MPSMAYDEPLGLYGASAVGCPAASTYWKATWPLAKSSRASSSLTTNLPSPWLTAIEWISPGRNPASHGEAVAATRVETICEMWRLMSLRKSVGDSRVTIPSRP